MERTLLTDQDVILRYRDLRGHGITFAHNTIRHMIEDGRFPPALELSSMAIGWRLSDIENWKANLPVRSRRPRPHSPETRAKMRAAWDRRRAQRNSGPEAA
jgi:predicted DNA-binding transcriptional regulator AlpA